MPTIKDIAPESVFTIELNAGTPGIQGPQGPQGVQGPVGPEGKIGPKPIRGIDYFTQQDISNMVSTITDNSNSAFNENVSVKTKEFNNNATDKQKAYNDNAEASLKAYNDNSTAKVKEYDDNATLKVEEYNSNANSKKEELNQISTNFEERITENEKYISDLEATIDILTNTNKAKGELVHITDALPLPTFENKIDGNVKQETTNGKNILYWTRPTFGTVTENEDGSFYFQYGYEQNLMKELTGELKSGTYTITNYGDLSLYIQSTTNDYTRKVNPNSSMTFTYDGTSFLRLTYTGTTVNTKQLFKVMLEPGDTATEYEPYTGGIASPNPDYPQEIEVIEGDLSFKVIGDNLFNPQKVVADSNNSDIYITDDGEWIRFKTGPSILHFYPEGIEKNTQYTFKATVKSGVKETNAIVVRAYYTDGTYGDIINTNIISDTNERTLTGITAKDKTVSYLRGAYSYGYEAFIKIEGTSLKKGTDTEYTPYQEQIVPLDLKGNWVGAINDTIKDYLVTDKKKYWLVKNVGKVVLDGSEEWYRMEFTQGAYYYQQVPKLGQQTTNGKLIISNCFKATNTWSEQVIGIWLDKNMIIKTKGSISGTETIDDFKTFLSNNNVEVYYQLAEPQIIELGELPEPIKTFEGVNNIQLLANLDTEIEVKYALDVKKYYDNKLAEISAQII